MRPWRQGHHHRNPDAVAFFAVEPGKDGPHLDADSRQSSDGYGSRTKSQPSAGQHRDDALGKFTHYPDDGQSFSRPVFVSYNHVFYRIELTGEMKIPEHGAEIEIWLEDERHILTKSCLIFAPRNLSHCPLVFHRIDNPVFFFTDGNGASYTRATGVEE